MKKLLLIITAVQFIMLNADTFIPMDMRQTDHLRAYGVVYHLLEEGVKVHWLLDYMGGSFIIENDDYASDYSAQMGVTTEKIDQAKKQVILSEIEQMNLKDILLEKAPRIAVYSPPGKEPWDDAVTLVLEYAKIPYDVIYDQDVLNGGIYKYEWLHLHHEDFTGQFDRFFISAYNEQWFRDMYESTVQLERSIGFEKYWKAKRAVAEELSNYVSKGGFLFAMCSATNSIDIALALGLQDNIPSILDNDGTENITLDYSSTFAFTDFHLNEMATMNLADINMEPANRLEFEGMKFTLHKFSPSIDPVDAMLTQNHTQYIPEFLGRTTAYDKAKIKPGIDILADAGDTRWAKYIHGIYGEGFFTFLAGHDPEDYVHYVFDPPTDLSLHRHSPGYRLILNNVLFPASQEKKKKT